MFTLNQLTEAHQSTVTTGADFPEYIQKIIALGVARYENLVTDGHAVYYSNDGGQLQTESKYTAMAIAVKAGTEKFVRRLQLHQQGRTDFITFCKDCAETGVDKWVVDTAAMTCTYYDTAGNDMLAEKIPGV